MFQSSSVKSTNGARFCMPALFTQMASGPTVSSMSAMPAATDAGSVTSKGRACTVAPVASRIWLAVMVNASALRALSTTTAPASASPVRECLADTAGGAGDQGDAAA